MQILSTWWNYWCHWCLIAQITFLHDLTLIMQLIFLRLKNMNVSVMICQSASELKGTNKQDHRYVSWQRIFYGTWGVCSWLRSALCKIQEQARTKPPPPLHACWFFVFFFFCFFWGESLDLWCPLKQWTWASLSSPWRFRKRPEPSPGITCCSESKLDLKSNFPRHPRVD